MSQADINGKSSFVFRKRYFNQISNLTVEQKAILLDKICEYQTNGRRTATMDSTDMLMSIMVDERKNDDEKYLEICERNKINGKHGGRPKKNRKNPVGLKKPKKADNDNDIGYIENKETYISKDIYTKKEEFETFWKTYPHARKGKKNESYEYFKNLDTAEVMKQTQILKRKINAGLLESQYVPACERWIRDFTPLNDDVIKQDLMKICKRHLNKGGDIKQRAMELKQTFGDQLINDTVKAIQQKDNPKNLFTNQT